MFSFWQMLTAFHNVLEAKLITHSGMSLSIATEWISNQGKAGFDKQDCEREAFKRLAEKIKKAYPRLPVIIVADRLYPWEGFFNICQQNRWNYIVTLKDNSLKTL
jgi:stalled ribosome rescue protein Dom34